MNEAVFITGASGFVGGALTRSLVNDGVTVRALARSDSSAATVEALGAEPVRGDLGSAEAIRAGAQGCAVAVHCAALASEWGSWSAFEEANVKGTANVLAGCAAAGVRRLIHVGTEAVHFAMRPLVQIDETEPLHPDSPIRYTATKSRAESLVRQANGSAFETIVVRPRLVWGPGDTTILPPFVDAVKTGKFVWVDGGRHMTSTAHIDNVVHGLRLALDRGHPGEAYFIADGEQSTFRDFLTALFKTRGVVPPDRSIPRIVARVAADVCETLWGSLSLPGTPPITRLAYYVVANEATLRIDKAREHLGYTPLLTVAEGLAALEARAADSHDANSVLGRVPA